MKMQQKLFRNLSESLRTEKAILYGWPTIKDKYFKCLKKKNNLSSMVSKFGVSKSTRVLNIALVKLHNNYSKIKKTSLSLHYFTKYFKKIREICKENASESKYIIKICLNSLAFPLNNFMAQIPNVRFSIF